jgi:Tfp pilus assembly protein PilO
MKLTSQQKLIIAILIIVVVVVAAVLLLIVPQVSRMNDLNAQIDQAEQDYEAATLLLTRRQEAKARAAATESELLRLSNEMPTSPELPALIIDLQNAANESGLKFAAIRPGEPFVEEGAVYTSVPIEMITRGTWQDCVDLLYRMRRITRQIRIARVETEYTEPEAESGETTSAPPPDVTHVQMAMDILVYTMDEEAAAATGTAAPPPPAE